MPTLRGGTFNLLYGRDPERVIREVSRLFDKHGLGFLCVQEFSDYRDDFKAAGWTVVPEHGPCESGVLVAPGVAVDEVSRHVYGDGWITVRGGRFPAAVHNEVRLAGWLRVRSVHLPTPTFWPNGRLMAPAERADDLRATMRGLWRFLARPGFWNARLVAGDWNEPPQTVGQWTPRWLARTTGSRLAVPTSREGHGRIDYAVVKGARVVEIFKDTTIPELSDHEPVIFKVVKR
jgi:endonuclease/exonuclease/phosphatase family metal-dependent hydrolase